MWAANLGKVREQSLGRRVGVQLVNDLDSRRGLFNCPALLVEEQDPRSRSPPRMPPPRPWRVMTKSASHPAELCLACGVRRRARYGVRDGGEWHSGGVRPRCRKCLLEGPVASAAEAAVANHTLVATLCAHAALKRLLDGPSRLQQQEQQEQEKEEEQQQAPAEYYAPKSTPAPLVVNQRSLGK